MNADHEDFLEGLLRLLEDHNAEIEAMGYDSPIDINFDKSVLETHCSFLDARTVTRLIGDLQK